jgi:regulator of cell morphogenesis and NO signaling
MRVRVNEKTTVRELVGRHPQTRPVFEEYGIDYCCGGGKCLTEAAGERGAKVSALLDALQKALETPVDKGEAVEKDWYATPLDELANHIIDAHHGYMKAALPRVRSLISKVLSAHGEHHGNMLRQVQDLFNALDAEITSHLMKEEQVLFPYIIAAATHLRHGAQPPSAPCGSARFPIGQMEHEHESAGQVLAKLREVTDNYSLPPDACPTFAALYEELQRMEADLHQHIHLENNILFPRTIALEE